METEKKQMPSDVSISGDFICGQNDNNRIGFVRGNMEELENVHIKKKMKKKRRAVGNMFN